MTQFSSLYGTRLDRELRTDDASVLFTTARRKAAINEGQDEFAELTECLVRWSTVAIVSGTKEYNLLSTSVLAGGDFARLAKYGVELRYTDASSQTTVYAGSDLPLRDVAWLNRERPGWQASTYTSGTAQIPECVYVRPDGGNLYLGLYPTPSLGSSASADLRVPYIARPTVLTSDTSEPFTVNSSVRTDLRTFHQALVHYAAHQLEKLRGDDQASDRQLQKFSGYVQRWIQNSRMKGGSLVTYAKSYFSPARIAVKDPRT